jgi:fatty acid synthase
MSAFLKNITFHGVLLDDLFEEGDPDWLEVSQLLREGIADGAVVPLKTTTFDKESVEAAFRFMAQGKHIGKVIIKVTTQKIHLNNESCTNENWTNLL